METPGDPRGVTAPGAVQKRDPCPEPWPRCLLELDQPVCSQIFC